ncbi:putative monooxygenase [Colletotrichum tanaceti]|uniref:Putative monooxygenase n=1 Tax=Colletotrichum tanaceti TaxID=1306861 RepID=A0A4U6X327_9PEZI|nr:putative monooxygenase [Colletotrichum tanaceti]TKW49760.1 putative monooxygenase [Colletotrichum tanaceti]
MQLMSLGLVFRALGVLATGYIVKFFVRLYQVRTKVRAVSKEHGVEMLPHSFLFGHLLVVGAVMAKQPPGLAGQVMPLLLLQQHPELCGKGVVYVDVWPVGPPMLAVFHPQIADQFTQARSLPKHAMMREEFEPLTGGNDLVNMEGPTWKTWRAVFNPGFSARNILSLVPAMVEEALVLRESLGRLADSGETVPLETGMMKATVDIIGRAVLGTRLHAQTTDSRLFGALQKQIRLLLPDNGPANFLKSINPIRPLVMRYHNHVMKREILPHIERQLHENVKEQQQQKQQQQQQNSNGPKTVNSLAITSYVKEVSAAAAATTTGLGSSEAKGTLDGQFVDMAISQLKIFLLAGHDTTASTLCFAYYLLHRYPAVLAKTRAEHDEVLGTDPALAASRIVEDPALLNRLTYTGAVLKETLRLYPPVGTVRQGSPDVVLTQPETGERFPTDGWMLFAASQTMHRWDALWPRPHEAVPERWLARDAEAEAEGDPDPLYYPPKSAFRPFELGPRNCIGQELAMAEMRLVLALTARELDVVPQFAADAPEVLGEKGFQWMTGTQITAHPKEGMPVKVFRRAES